MIQLRGQVVQVDPPSFIGVKAVFDGSSPVELRIGEVRGIVRAR